MVSYAPIGNIGNRRKLPDLMTDFEKKICRMNSTSSSPCPVRPALSHVILKSGKALRSVSSSADGPQKPGRR
jgi:hypothetical protein